MLKETFFVATIATLGKPLNVRVHIAEGGINIDEMDEGGKASPIANGNLEIQILALMLHTFAHSGCPFKTRSDVAGKTTFEMGTIKAPGMPQA